jgi:hypothetical protein
MSDSVNGFSSSQHPTMTKTSKEVEQFRLDNGMCPVCGAVIYQLDGNGRWTSFEMPGVVHQGRCLYCYPDRCIQEAPHEEPPLAHEPELHDLFPDLELHHEHHLTEDDPSVTPMTPPLEAVPSLETAITRAVVVGIDIVINLRFNASSPSAWSTCGPTKVMEIPHSPKEGEAPRRPYSYTSRK